MKTLKWGLIGAGDIARKRIAPALRDLENCVPFSVSRSRADLAESFAKEFGIPKWFADWRDLLCDEEIDAVYIATPVFLHKEQTIFAAEHGKHILCEKPLSLSVAECDEMIAACKANEVKLGVAYYRNFYPLINRIKEIINSGEIGNPVFAQINAFEFFDPAEDNPRRWLIEKEKSGGGPMMDFGCHRLEVFHNLFGKVKNLKSIVTNSNFGREVEDTAMAVFQFENGVCANLNVTHAALEPQDTLDIFCTKGSIHIPFLNKDELRIKTEKGERIESHPPHSNIHQPLIAEFTEAVLQNRNPKLDGETGRYIAELEERIYGEK